MQPTVPESAALLRATIAQIALRVPDADNLGQSDDWRDLYYLLDYLSFAVDKAYPEIPCSKGCSHCCHNQLFRVTEAEWAAVKQAIDAMPEATRASVYAQAVAMYGPHRPALEAMAGRWSAGRGIEREWHDATPKSCPLLVDGRCSVYEKRPGICRGYGYFSATIDREASLLICKQEGPGWIRQLEESGVDQLPMPNWNPVQRRIEALNGEGPIKPLPLWLLEEAAATSQPA